MLAHRSQLPQPYRIGQPCRHRDVDHPAGAGLVGPRRARSHAGLGAEVINSAFERLIDHLHPELHSEIGFIKDMAAGSVLLISIGALVIAGALAATLI
jgi:hypothetical protein